MAKKAKMSMPYMEVPAATPKAKVKAKTKAKAFSGKETSEEEKMEQNFRSGTTTFGGKKRGN